MKASDTTYSEKVAAVLADTSGFRIACNACEFLARANNVITVLFVGFMLERGTPNSGRFLVKLPPFNKSNFELIYF